MLRVVGRLGARGLWRSKVQCMRPRYGDTARDLRTGNVCLSVDKDGDGFFGSLKERFAGKTVAGDDESKREVFVDLEDNVEEEEEGHEDVSALPDSAELAVVGICEKLIGSSRGTEDWRGYVFENQRDKFIVLKEAAELWRAGVPNYALSGIKCVGDLIKYYEEHSGGPVRLRDRPIFGEDIDFDNLPPNLSIETPKP